MTDTMVAGADNGPVALHDVVIRFAGDSGDGMQLTGDRFTLASALFGNDLATQPDFPAEIRAPAGTLPGVSAFQVRIADHPISTPGDAPTVLVAMNPAALRNEIDKLVAGGTVIINTDAFEERDLHKAGYHANPLDDDSLNGFHVIRVPMTSLVADAVKEFGVKSRDAERSKNFFALGLVSWMYSRPVQVNETWIHERFGKNDLVMRSNLAAFRAGLHFGETTEANARYIVPPSATREPGEYTSINGNTATAWGLIAAGQSAKLPIFLGSYPITPASDILHELAKQKHFGVRTVQCEDEIAGICTAIGASFAGQLAITTTSGPGIALKGEAMGLAVSYELPLIVIDVQRGGPSTGLPTKTEAADLLMAMFGRPSESPLPIVAAYSPSHCFWAAIEAARIALKYRTPVMLLTDGYLANATEPWKIPDVSTFPDISVPFATETNHIDEQGQAVFWPYIRDPETLARPWAIPGTPNLRHRLGGIEKEDGSGNISYDPVNHEHMVKLRAAKVAGIVHDIPDAEVAGDVDDADVLILGWGSTHGAIRAGMERLRLDGRKVAHVHLVHLNPFPANLGAVLKRYPKVIMPELNLGQLAMLVRAAFLVDARPVSKVQGLPFTSADIVNAAEAALRS